MGKDQATFTSWHLQFASAIVLLPPIDNHYSPHRGLQGLEMAHNSFQSSLTLLALAS